MIATEIGPFDSIEDAMLDGDGNPMGHGRPDGLHLSTVVKRRRQARGGKGAPAGWQGGTAMYFGFLWEWALELAFKALGLVRPNLVRQLRLYVDGIHMTTDGVDFSDEEPVLEEYKATWRSMKRVDCGQPVEACLDGDFPEWLDQIMGYLYALSVTLERPVTVCRLFILFANGDYRGTGPRIRVFELRFTEEELRAHWRAIQAEAEEIKADGH